MADSNDNIPAEILTLLDLLDSVDLQTQYEAACSLARMSMSSSVAARVSRRLIDLAMAHTDQRVCSALGIASSMVAARNGPPGGIFSGSYIPDFLPSWEDA